MSSVRIPIPAVDFQPPVYYCRRATLPFTLDGRLDKDFWKDAPATAEFLDIEGSHMPLPRFVTYAKILWDDENIYFGAQLNGDEIWGNVTGRDEVIFHDNDFEIFLDPDSDTQQYYEFEMNVLNTVWDLFLPIAYRDGGSALNGYDIHGLRSAVHVDGGEIGVPGSGCKSWSVEVVIPFAAVTECYPGHSLPKAGDFYRLNFSRVQWKVDTASGSYVKCTDPATGAVLPEDNWVWAPTGVINIHYPELWGFLFFVDETTETLPSIPEDEYRKWELRKLYYAQQICMDTEDSFSSDLAHLCAVLKAYSPIEGNASVRELDYCIETTSSGFELSCSAADGKHRLVLTTNGKIFRI